MKLAHIGGSHIFHVKQELHQVFYYKKAIACSTPWECICAGKPLNRTGHDKMEKSIVVGAEQMLRDLKKVEPELYKEVRSQIINELKPLYSKIKSNIPRVSPLDGFNHDGRTGWGGPIRVLGKINLRKRPGQTSLVSIRTENTAVQIQDMAGRKSNGNTASGKKMIENLPGAASRYVYPAVERYVPTLNNDIIKIIDKYSSAKNVELAKNPKGL